MRPPHHLRLRLLLLLVAACLPPPATCRHIYPPPPPLGRRHQQQNGSGTNVPTAALAAAASLLALLLLYLCAAIAVRRFRSRGAPLAQEPAASRAAAFLRRHRLHHHRPAFTYEQLRAATAGFDPARKLGDGGFGTVFLAHLPPAGRLAAVKRLHFPPPSSSLPSASASAAITKSFCNEVLILSALRHPHLVRLHGFCADPRALLLVYDFVPNGTLSHHLHRRARSGSAAAPLADPPRDGLPDRVGARVPPLGREAPRGAPRRHHVHARTPVPVGFRRSCRLSCHAISWLLVLRSQDSVVSTGPYHDCASTSKVTGMEANVN